MEKRESLSMDPESNTGHFALCGLLIKMIFMQINISLFYIAWSKEGEKRMA